MRHSLEGLISTLQTNSMHIEGKLQVSTMKMSLIMCINVDVYLKCRSETENTSFLDDQFD